MQPDPNPLAHLLRETAALEILPRLRRATLSHKADGTLVTETDLAVQSRIRAALARDFPDLPLLGEEMSAAEQESLLTSAQRGVWVLDPLDGTSNYACGYPGFAISLALVEGGVPVLGVVLDPVRDECFHASRGGGAFLDGQPIRPYAPSPNLEDCLASIDLKRIPPGRVPALLRPGGFRSQRNLGAVALEWCWLASGRFQLYLHGGQKLWDYAAGRLIATEAGIPSRLYQPDGTAPAEGLALGQRLAVAAANPDLLAAWLDFIALPLTPVASPDPL
jgi:myo-inositol-1(or 4)-monophosphatase